MLQHVIGQLALFLIVSIAIVLLLRLLLRRTLRHTEGDSLADTAMEPLAGVYGLLLAFLVTTVADRAAELRRAVDIEAESIERLEYISTQLSDSAGTNLRVAVQRYVQLENAARRNTPGPESSSEQLADVWLAVTAFEGQRPRDAMLQQEALEELAILREYRPAAARAHRHAIGPAVWLVLGIGAISIIGVCLVAGLGDPRAPIYLTALTAVIATTLYVLYVLSRPLFALPAGVSITR
jgi:hypothetical protein